MRVHRFGAWARFAVGVFAFALLCPRGGHAGVKVVEQPDFSLELGLRMQPRLVFLQIPAAGGGFEMERTFLIRRSRFKANGKMLTASYNFEWRLDATGLSSGIVLTTPIAGVENAWIQLPLRGPEFQVRMGLYDQPFSRDRLTSDSKQLAVDRGAVSNVPAALGMADNAIGFDFRGDVKEGRYSYAVGLFDNRTIPAKLQDMPMVVGRLDWNLGSTKNLFRDAQFGDESWYSLGVNGIYHGALEDTTGADDGVRAAAGIDGIIDIPAGPGRLFVRGELNTIRVERPQSDIALDTTVWMAGAGFLFWKERLQPIVRFDQVQLDDDQGGATQDITLVGVNYYQKGHNLKLQADVRLQGGTGESIDEARLQWQIDF